MSVDIFWGKAHILHRTTVIVHFLPKLGRELSHDLFLPFFCNISLNESDCF